jgi:branched-chain amino acid transport system ATP-binding protein
VNAAEAAVPALQAVGVVKRFGSFTALESIDLAVRPGTLHAIIGPNGAGKTTLFNVLTGQLAPSAGTVLVHGDQVHRLPVHRRVGLGLARCFQVTSLFPDLSVAENLRLAAQGRHASRAFNFWSSVGSHRAAIERAHAVLERVGLERVADRRAAELSHGQQRLLEVAMSIAPEPRILLLDEPTSGMGIDDVPLMERLLRELTGEYTIVMIEHNMAMTMRVADRIAVLVAGNILLDGEPRDIRADERVQRAYLGQGLSA